MSDVKFQLEVSICKCHEELEEQCPFIRTLRELQAHKFADAMTEKRALPDV